MNDFFEEVRKEMGRTNPLRLKVEDAINRYITARVEYQKITKEEFIASICDELKNKYKNVNEDIAFDYLRYLGELNCINLTLSLYKKESRENFLNGVEQDVKESMEQIIKQKILKNKREIEEYRSYLKGVSALNLVYFEITQKPPKELVNEPKFIQLVKDTKIYLDYMLSTPPFGLKLKISKIPAKSH